MIDALLKPGSIAEIVLLWTAFYAILKFIRGTRGAGLLKGVVFLIVVGFVGFLYLAELGGLFHIKEMMKWIISGSTVALIVIFAPELRRALLRLAQSRLLSPLLHEHSSAFLGEIVQAAVRLSKNRIGALVAIEREVGLTDIIENANATKIDARLSSEVLEMIFYPGNPLHDGAVIVQHDRVAAAGCLLPLSDDPSLTKSLGTRHRAALGLSEDTDAIVIVVSEETGRISLCVEGKLYGGLDRDTLDKTLQKLYAERGRPDIVSRTDPGTRHYPATPRTEAETKKEEPAKPADAPRPAPSNDGETPRTEAETKKEEPAKPAAPRSADGPAPSNGGGAGRTEPEAKKKEPKK